MTVSLYHGDCLVEMAKIPDRSVDLILTDIPYGEVNRESNGLRVLDKGVADVETFPLEAFLRECDRVCRGSIYVFCGTLQVSQILRFLRERRMSTRCLVWEKTNPSPMNADKVWLSGIELCAYGKKPKAAFNSFYRSTVLRYPVGQSKAHPTQKPLLLMEELVRVSSDEEDIVLDPCMGSGTTGVACVNTGRRFIGIEKDETYFKVAEKRIAEASRTEQVRLFQ